MSTPGPTATSFDLPNHLRTVHEPLVRKATSPKPAVIRAEIVLLAAEGTPMTAIVDELGYREIDGSEMANSFRSRGASGAQGYASWWPPGDV